MRALELIDRFDAAHAAAVAVGPDGAVLATHGDLDHRFPLASVTKLLTTMAVLVAAEEGTLSLADPLGPQGSTVAHLLAHASGLSQHDARVALAVPGAKRIYSNVAFDVLGGHLEQSAGMAFADYLTEGVLAPLAMSATTCHGSPASSGAATIGDLGRLLGELMRPTLISAGMFARATSVAFPGLVGVVPGFGRQDPCDWGLGFEVKSGKSPHWTGSTNSPSSFGHFGQSGTFVLVDPAFGIGLGLLTDRDFDEWAKSAWPPLCDAAFAEAASLI